VPIVIGGVSKVVIEVEDQERAKRFWTQTLGFEVIQDAPYGEERWLEVCTPDKAVAVVLDIRKGPRPAPQDRSLPTSNVSFYTDDLNQTHTELTARGGRVPPAARPATVRLVVDLRGSGRQPLRAGAPRPVGRTSPCPTNR
jgi:catechol 2,3-dioxygenase-like lactoylglutathione lyase family enzyme